MNSYETKDIWIASALFSTGFNCKAERVGDRQFVFVFDDSPDLRDAVNRYMRNNLPIDVSTLQTSYKTLKNLTFN
jgi:hypothetical protein